MPWKWARLAKKNHCAFWGLFLSRFRFIEHCDKVDNWVKIDGLRPIIKLTKCELEHQLEFQVMNGFCLAFARGEKQIEFLG